MIKKLIYTILTLAVSLTVTAQKHSAKKFITKNHEEVFIGAVLDTKSINTDRHKLVNFTLPTTITYSYSLPIESREIVPSYSDMITAIQNDIDKAHLDNTSQASFSHTIKEISSFHELEDFFGESINIQKYFGIHIQSKPKATTIVLDITQELFNISMDFPTNANHYRNNPEIAQNIDDYIYVSDLSFGRKVTIVIESDLAYSDVKFAIDEALSRDNCTFSEKSQVVLSNCRITILNIGNHALGLGTRSNPFSNIVDYLSKPLSTDDFGVPLYITGSHIKDDSLYEHMY